MVIADCSVGLWCVNDVCTKVAGVGMVGLAWGIGMCLGCVWVSEFCTSGIVGFG